MNLSDFLLKSVERKKVEAFTRLLLIEQRFEISLFNCAQLTVFWCSEGTDLLWPRLLYPPQLPPPTLSNVPGKQGLSSNDVS